MLMRRCFTRSDNKGSLQGSSSGRNFKPALGAFALAPMLVSKTLQQVHAAMHLSKTLCTFSLEGPVKVIYPSVDLVYRSAFPLVRVEFTLTRR